MDPRPITKLDTQLFPGTKLIFKCPPDLPNCNPVETIISRTDSGAGIRIPWTLSAHERMMLLDDALEPTFWLTVFGSQLPPVDLQLIMTDKVAPVAESADAEDLKSSGENRSGSSPDGGTNGND